MEGPLPQYQSTFDIMPVLAYVESLHLLFFKALFLTVYSSISRVNSMACLAPPLQVIGDSVVLHLEVRSVNFDLSNYILMYLQVS